MLCANFATFTVAGGTLAATGTVYSANPCNDLDKVIMTAGEVALMTSPASKWTAAEGSALAWQIGGVWLAVAFLMYLSRVVRSGWGSNESDQS